MFHNNIVKISEKKNEQANVLKIALKLTYLTYFCIICVHFYYGEKVKIFDFIKKKQKKKNKKKKKKKTMIRIKLFCT